MTQYPTVTYETFLILKCCQAGLTRQQIKTTMVQNKYDVVVWWQLYKLTKQGVVTKSPNGVYTLTEEGAKVLTHVTHNLGPNRG